MSPSPAPEVERIRTARLELATERRGSGAPVLFVSGTGGDLRKTPSVLDGPLAEAFEVLACSPGHA